MTPSGLTLRTPLYTHGPLVQSEPSFQTGLWHRIRLVLTLSEYVGSVGKEFWRSDMFLNDFSTQANSRAATLRQKQQVRLAISRSHSFLDTSPTSPITDPMAPDDRSLDDLF